MRPVGLELCLCLCTGGCTIHNIQTMLGNQTSLSKRSMLYVFADDKRRATLQSIVLITTFKVLYVTTGLLARREVARCRVRSAWLSGAGLPAQCAALSYVARGCMAQSCKVQGYEAPGLCGLRVLLQNCGTL